MHAILKPVTYHPSSSPSFQLRVTSRFHFERTLDVLREGIAAKDMWVVHEINPQMLLEKGGYGIHPARQLLYFHPRYVEQILTTDPTALVEIPLKLVVLQDADGEVTVRFNSVHSLLGRYEGLTGMANELTAISVDLLESVARA